MTFPKNSAFAQEDELQKHHREQEQRRQNDEKIAQTLDAVRAVAPNVNTKHLREILEEMVIEAAEEHPDDERISSLAREARDEVLAIG